MTLTGLPDTRKIREAQMFRTAAQGMAILRRGLAGCAASDNGAINIWKDKTQTYRGERQRYMQRQSEGRFTTLRELAAWLRAELSKIQ